MQCLDRRIAHRAELESEIAAWETRRNASAERIRWMFDCEAAPEKIARAYAQVGPKADSLQAAA